MLEAQVKGMIFLVGYFYMAPGTPMVLITKPRVWAILLITMLLTAWKLPTYRQCMFHFPSLWDNLWELFTFWSIYNFSNVSILNLFNVIKMLVKQDLCFLSRGLTFPYEFYAEATLEICTHNWKNLFHTLPYQVSHLMKRYSFHSGLAVVWIGKLCSLYAYFVLHW